MACTWKHWNGTINRALEVEESCCNTGVDGTDEDNCYDVAASLLVVSLFPSSLLKTYQYIYIYVCVCVRVFIIIICVCGGGEYSR